MVVSWFCLRGKHWAPWIGAVLAATNLHGPIKACLGEPTMFRSIYESNNPYLSFLVHLVMSIIFLIQLALFVCAIIKNMTNRDTQIAAKLN